ncbi:MULTISPECIES: 3-oxoacyl-ACP synthase III family protein [Pseudomonas]|jgi:3-oxoacyl-[acyl-carrier-protein] synthase-3|uniref:3-oxoacyl-[acyl-carrier-protein] synthase-3 n=1 Tax=Pseudomonas mandelii TaxID=75612 RepID=A0AB36CQT6_9PSED|nr:MULTISPECIES: ketoacyl-ACP synthase III [Pseudomonas]MBU0525916.1 ketoacyl-ACP synthase III [Gammaproteobacteria bacterium]MDF9883177.1 3-oxoacyl-[acyl-carrier-protein] synthase-3 [Pseudomonas silensiensis]MBU0818870.1 ketoacyl-ACP synthase III [Gammaproteobacteria bacterium]MBU0844274.1 ketoacyl-ACP synthase III [Gammaproteobacteria bacterium]MBU1843571.1 ketoacyl-ACP synthase III [Gammaproteobacteria bacterium]
MSASIDGVSIRALSAAVPQDVMTLADFATLFGEKEVQRIAKSTGIHQVRVANRLSTVDLCAAAARSLFNAADIDPASIDGLVVVTQTPDSLMPASSAILADRLGLKKGLAAFDLNFGCSGYIYGLFQAAMLIKAGGCRRVLVCTGDVISKLLNPEDRHVRLVFGDAATCTLLECGDQTLGFAFDTDGAGAQYLNTALDYTPGSTSRVQAAGLHMDGGQVMNFALEKVPSAINAFLRDKGIDPDRVPFFLLHQANKFMLDYLAKKLGVSPARVPIEVADVGNTGPSSIPLMICKRHDREDLRQDNLIACGFGVGLSIGVAHLSLRDALIVDPVEVPALPN